jgi:hypothetical protein
MPVRRAVVPVVGIAGSLGALLVPKLQAMLGAIASVFGIDPGTANYIAFLVAVYGLWVIAVNPWLYFLIPVEGTLAFLLWWFGIAQTAAW